MKTKIEKHIVRNRRMLTVAATLFFAGAVFQITADKCPEGIIYFIAAACFAYIPEIKSLGSVDPRPFIYNKYGIINKGRKKSDKGYF